MASNKTPIGSLTDSMFDEIETGRGTFKPARLAASDTDSALMGRRPPTSSQAMRDYSWAYGYASPEQNYLAKRLPSSTSRAGAGEHPAAGRYTGCHAGVGVDQINGVVVVCGPEAAEYGLEAPKGTYLYSDCTKEGSGVQVNGLDVVYYGSGSKVPNHPGMDGEWHGMMMVSGDGAELKGTKNQINGGRIRKIGRSDENRVRQYIR